MANLKIQTWKSKGFSRIRAVTEYISSTELLQFLISHSI